MLPENVRLNFFFLCKKSLRAQLGTRLLLLEWSVCFTLVLHCESSRGTLKNCVEKIQFPCTFGQEFRVTSSVRKNASLP